MPTQNLKIGMIGLDTSHVIAFTDLLHNEQHSYHVPGGEVVAAYPGGSPDFPASSSRIEGFTTELRDKYRVRIVDNIRDIPETCDAILLESVDGRVHLSQFRKIVEFGKPVFVDKPFVLTSHDAKEMVRLAQAYGTPLMSCSALRFSEALISALSVNNGGRVTGCDTFGPMAIEPTQPGVFWYGIHCVEMLFAVLGPDCVSVRAITNEDYDEIVGVWSDGRIGTIRGNRIGNSQFAAILHREKSIQYVDISGCDKPFYASLLENIIQFFQTGVPTCDLEMTCRIVHFMEQANKSRPSGEILSLI
ncbi:Gfo/Idh/MocA family oxidoreductase [Alicyclobacillus fastidiosus]|uniref:Gfo/Idh/MocA family oxidoreductase n=1 Tax=Alicyclobacillus fastidiosus TaxID=392011 RepID=A0ABY6ZDM3_9BACL|nr:Gfo/Idh/MocA family oxidoreductase [Alicyclobacillus fastidiosus]WAH40612.1 Gfo/Idh/MocA family oxidoreductase [Alicyclobacillus fastidiosus]GMA62053.1 dehydrogenase [Alicyclobacillus fastidiosus]